MMHTLLSLFLSFVKIGFTSFGGAAMVPLVNAEMISHGWMTETEVLDIVAIAEMTPGPLGTNCATFAGVRVAGAPGAIAANLGVLTPTLTLAVIVGFFMEAFKDNRYLRGALSGIRPASIGLILATMITMSVSNYVSWQTIAIGLTAAFLIWRFKLGVPFVVLISAALGILIIR